MIEARQEFYGHFSTFSIINYAFGACFLTAPHSAASLFCVSIRIASRLSPLLERSSGYMVRGREAMKNDTHTAAA